MVPFRLSAALPRAAMGLLLVVGIAACGDSGSTSDGSGYSDPTATAPTVVLEYVAVPMSAAFAVPTVSGRSETGSTTLRLREDNTLEFSLSVANLDPADSLTVAHIHEGGVTESGSVYIGLVDGSTIAFSGASAGGTVTVTAAEAAALLDTTRSFYVNVHSTGSPSGLVRAQLGVTIDRAMNIALSPANVVPPITGRSDTGEAILRILSDGTLAYTLIVTGLDVAGDTPTNAHIHTGDAATSGGVYVGFSPTFVLDASVAGRFTATGTVPLSALNLTDLADATQAFYVNIHSSQVGGGLMRGQLPNPNATLTWVQNNVFTVSCALSGCHGGSSPQQGMSLTASAVPASIVHVTSSEVPSLKRIAPGNPDNSYLVRKLEGTAAVGVRMPASGGILSAATIAVIREWITLGARDD